MRKTKGKLTYKMFCCPDSSKFRHYRSQDDKTPPPGKKKSTKDKGSNFIFRIIVFQRSTWSQSCVKYSYAFCLMRRGRLIRQHTLQQYQRQLMKKKILGYVSNPKSSINCLTVRTQSQGQHCGR